MVAERKTEQEWIEGIMECIVIDCKKKAEVGIPWCEEHLDEFADLVEKYGIGENSGKEDINKHIE